MPTKRILVFRGGAIGDFVLTLPALRALREAYPAAELLLVAHKPIAAIARDAIGPVEIYSIDDPTLAPFFVGDSELPNSWRTIFGSCDLIVSYLHDPEGAFEKNLAKCGAGRFVRGPAKIVGITPAAAQLASPLIELGIEAVDLRPRLHFAQQAIQQARGRLGGSPDFVLHPGSGSARKNWPIERWLSLADDLLKTGQRVAVTGGEADCEQITHFRNNFRDHRLRFAIDWPLRELGALLAETAFIGHDTGISHLAAASGARCLILFGATDPEIWAPKGENLRVIRAPGDNLRDLHLAPVRAAASQYCCQFTN